MRYIKHDAASNFSNASGSKDISSAKDLLTDELSEAIIHNKKDVIDILRSSAIKVSDNPTNRELVNKLINDIDTNKALKGNIALLIGKRHGHKISGKGYSNFSTPCWLKFPFDADQRKACESGGALDDSDVGTNPNKLASSNAGVGGKADIISAALGALSSIFGSKKKAEAAREEQKTAIISALAAKGQSGGISMGASIAIVLGLITLVGTGIYLFTLKRP